MQVCHCDTQVVVCVVREDGWTKITETYQTHTEKEITLLLTTDTIWTNVSIDARLRNIPRLGIQKANVSQSKLCYGRKHSLISRRFVRGTDPKHM